MCNWRNHAILYMGDIFLVDQIVEKVKLHIVHHDTYYNRTMISDVGNTILFCTLQSSKITLQQYSRNTDRYMPNNREHTPVMRDC